MNYPTEKQQQMDHAAYAATQRRAADFNADVNAAVMSQLRTHAAKMQGAALGASTNMQQIASARPSNEIEDRVGRVLLALERLHSRIASMEDRLRPVMRATGSGKCGGPASPEEALSPLADSIRSIEQRIEGAAERLESLLANIAL